MSIHTRTPDPPPAPRTARHRAGEGSGTWLLTGGAGYIGAHIARTLRSTGREVVILDDLSTGRSDRVAGFPLIRSSILAGPTETATLLTENSVQGVIHLAAKKAVAESFSESIHYYEQNVVGTVHLMRAAALAGVSQIIYSSSAAVYGAATGRPLTEDDVTSPGNPYGETKLAAEWAVRRAAEAHGMAWTTLRYFNVAGAADSLLADRGITNLLPIALSCAMSRKPVHVFGGDWPTADGSCIRDYVHVEDLADAHCAAVAGMEESGAGAGILNVGRGHGVSVYEMLDAIARHSGLPLERLVTARRPGDVASVVADVSRIRERLGWQATRDLDDIVSSSIRAWQPQGGLEEQPATQGWLRAHS